MLARSESCMCVSGWVSGVGDDGGDTWPSLECADGDGGGGLLLRLRDGEMDTLFLTCLDAMSVVVREGKLKYIPKKQIKIMCH